MKFTKVKLEQIVKEEIQKVIEFNQPAGTDTPPEQTGAPEEKEQRDVTVVLKYISKINNVTEYYQLVKAILAHNVRGKTMALRKVSPKLARLFPDAPKA